MKNVLPGFNFWEEMWNEEKTNTMKDSIVEQVRQDLLERSETGIKKYNTTLDRTDLGLKEWLKHQYEELLDAALYTRRAIKELEEKQVN